MFIRITALPRENNGLVSTLYIHCPSYFPAKLYALRYFPGRMTFIEKLSEKS